MEHSAVFGQRLERVRESLRAGGVDAALLSIGPDLPWLIGYQAMPMERLTMLVVPADGLPVLVIPAFEAARVIEYPDLFKIQGWG